jgi:hypothetical protein
MAKKVPFHPLVEKITKGKDAPPELQRVRGFLGPGAADGRVRIYSDLSLQHYVEVEEQFIRHIEQPAGAAADAGGEAAAAEIWLDARTPLTLGDLGALLHLVPMGSYLPPVLPPDPKPGKPGKPGKPSKPGKPTPVAGPLSLAEAMKMGETLRAIWIPPYIREDPKPVPPPPPPKRGGSK